MLTEALLVGVQKSGAGGNAAGGIYIHELQPLAGLRTTFKKSSAKSNGIALTSNHVFAAQADKAVVNVYNRQTGQHEDLVPFPEKIRSIAVANGTDAGVVVLGTEAGGLVIWEVSLILQSLLCDNGGLFYCLTSTAGMMVLSVHFLIKLVDGVILLGKVRSCTLAKDRSIRDVSRLLHSIIYRR